MKHFHLSTSHFETLHSCFFKKRKKTRKVVTSENAALLAAKINPWLLSNFIPTSFVLHFTEGKELQSDILKDQERSYYWYVRECFDSLEEEK